METSMIRSLIAIQTLFILLLSTSSYAAGEKEYQTLYKQGVEQNKKGNFKEAINLYSQAIAKKPDSAELYFVRGRSFRQNEQYDDAFRDFEKAITLKPKYAEAYSQRGVLFIGKSDNEKARKDFKKACDLGYSEGCGNLKKLEEMQKKR
jgi:tetratricopeptide (TPR) repeat protein